MSKNNKELEDKLNKSIVQQSQFNAKTIEMFTNICISLDNLNARIKKIEQEEEECPVIQ